MRIETLCLYLLRLWLAGMMHTGLFISRVGPFGLACAGFAGWHLATRNGWRPNQRAAKPAGEPTFQLR